MAATPKTYTGQDAAIKIGSGSTTLSHTVLAISDFSLTFDRSTVEQELVGEAGNYFTQGAMSIDGSLTSCKLGSGATGLMLGSIVNSYNVWVSGAVASTSGLKFFFKSCQITGFDISIGDASTITEGSIDFTVLDPYNVTKSFGTNGSIWLKD